MYNIGLKCKDKTLHMILYQNMTITCPRGWSPVSAVAEVSPLGPGSVSGHRVVVSLVLLPPGLDAGLRPPRHLRHQVLRAVGRPARAQRQTVCRGVCEHGSILYCV